MKDLKTTWKNDQRMTTKDVAGELFCSRDFVCRLIRSGKLPVVMLGKRRRYVLRSDFEEFLKGAYSRK
jgi:excisionase family DNA binding protein